ncbi:hypothetical protein L1887_57831 [Cichorium endivia]|nr:hypothetical protein L1887_57831 [Cichorium endivia]
MQPSTSSGASGDMATNNMLSLASLFQNSINGSTPNPNSVSTSLAAPTQSVGAPAPNQDMSGLGGAGWLGLGGGPGGYEGGGSGFGGDSAGGNEFTLLSEFLESLDGPGFGAGATPGMTAAGASGSGLTPSQSRRNTISGLAPRAAWVRLMGSPRFTPINNSDTTAHARASLPAMPSAGAASMYDSGSASTGGAAGFGNYATGNNSANQAEASGGKRSRRSSYSAAAPSSSGAAAAASTSVAASGSYIPSLQGGSTKTERFFLTAADQKDGTRDERLARVIQAKYEAGLLRPYNHVNGYARLNRWMERNVSAASKRRILKPLSVFRPAFRSSRTESHQHRPSLHRRGVRAAAARLRPRLQHAGHPRVPVAQNGRDLQGQQGVCRTRRCAHRIAPRGKAVHLRAHGRGERGQLLGEVRRGQLRPGPEGRLDFVRAQDQEQGHRRRRNERQGGQRHCGPTAQISHRVRANHTRRSGTAATRRSSRTSRGGNRRN